jgi:hypothetical protein
VIDACDWCHDWEGGVYAWPCSDARRYAEARDDVLDDLRRVGRLYGISETNAPGSPERTSGAISERASTEQAGQ